MNRLFELGTRMTPRGLARLANDVVFVEGKGSFMYDTAGKKYLDFACGIGVTSTVQAVQEQAAKVIHAQINNGFHQKQLELYEKLSEITPDELDSVILRNSGSEAVEDAVKLARKATGRKNIIVFRGSFHGRTLGTLGMGTSDTKYNLGFGPFIPGIHVAPFPYAAKFQWLNSEDELSAYCLNELKRVLKQESNPADTAAIIIEPILGEGGYVVAPNAFMKGLAALCKEHGILFICDEVQSGFGRTGKYFAFEHAGVVPDILVMAKGIASGMPISCVMANAKLTDTLHPGAIGGTYSGNALSCAAAIATIEVFEEEKLLENAAIRGKQLREGLERIKNAHNDKILEVRGRGLMVGFEFKNVPYGSAQSVSEECLRHGMLILRCSSYETLRFIPPLTVTKEEIETGLQIFEDSLKIVM